VQLVGQIISMGKTGAAGPHLRRGASRWREEPFHPRRDDGRGRPGLKVDDFGGNVQQWPETEAQRFRSALPTGSFQKHFELLAGPFRRTLKSDFGSPVRRALVHVPLRKWCGNSVWASPVPGGRQCHVSQCPWTTEKFSVGQRGKPALR